MTLEQAKKLSETLFEGAKGCRACPNESNCAKGSSIAVCMDFHVAVGIQLGYNKALEDLKATKTLAENRGD